MVEEEGICLKVARISVSIYESEDDRTMRHRRTHGIGLGALSVATRGAVNTWVLFPKADAE